MLEIVFCFCSVCDQNPHFFLLLFNFEIFSLSKFPNGNPADQIEIFMHLEI